MYSYRKPVCTSPSTRRWKVGCSRARCPTSSQKVPAPLRSRPTPDPTGWAGPARKGIADLSNRILAAEQHRGSTSAIRRALNALVAN